ncbi:MAG: hypothetical protein IT317_21695 [Anaerolineales bacterium]|nr:hypothetical protein [Anaerolineales bacterium]
MSFLLTLLIDGDDPENLRGRLRAVLHDRERTFANAPELLNALFAEVADGLAPPADMPATPTTSDAPGDGLTVPPAGGGPTL